MPLSAYLKRIVALSESASRTFREEGTAATIRKTRDFLAARLTKSEQNAAPTRKWENTFALLLPEDGATPARRPDIRDDVAIKVPFAHRDSPPDVKPAVVVHVFYVEMFDEMLGLIVEALDTFALFISTDTEQKRAEIETILQNRNVKDYEIRVFPNRGRDITAKVAGFSDVYDQFEIVLHLHTKLSPHSDTLAGWRSYLLRNLIGSRDIAQSNISLLFAPSKVGLVFPQHYSVVRSQLNWGYNYKLASQLLGRIGYSLSKDALLEFPSGSMFWARTAALKPLIDLQLAYDDFPEESGQTDGTLAHAIERSFLHVVEHTGFRWAKVHDGNGWPEGCVLYDIDDVGTDAAIVAVHKPLFEEHGREHFKLPAARSELRPIQLRQSLNQRPRLNLMVPTLYPSQVFGGIATALRLFDEIADQVPTIERRIIVLDTPMTMPSWSSVPGYGPSPDNPAGANASAAKTALSVFDRAHTALDIRKNDIFVSTAWWSEYLRRQIDTFQTRLFGRAPKGLYLVQDYESGFMKWSSEWGIAESTYTFRNCLQVVNSEELYNFYEAKGCLTDAFVLPYRINRTIHETVIPAVKERLILCYGRPTATRNCFETIVDGLALWQQRHPHIATGWTILFLGEMFPQDQLYPVQNATVVGKASIGDYAALLSRASVGISLMISPHPSYPPLEMAHAGLQVISNDFATKRMELRSPNIAALPEITPEALAIALETAVERAEPGIGIPGKIAPVAAIECSGRRYDAKTIADILVSPLS